MSKKTQANKKLKKAGAPSPTGSNARERARLEAQAAKRRKDRLTLIIVALVVVALVVGGGIAYSWFQSTRTPTAGPGAGADAKQEVSLNEPVVFGTADAPNTVAVWADFHCPYCIDFELEYGPIIEKAIETGEWKQEVWPMSFISPGSSSAANAFACATEEGFGRSYQRALFENSNLEWNNDQLLSLAGQVTGDVPPGFNSCVQNLEKRDWVDSINTTSRANGVTGTPTVKINGENYDLNGITPEQFAERLGVQP